MAKKVISFSLILFVVFLGYQFIINFLKTEHSVTYKVKDYVIDEDYVKNENDYYLFRVKTEDGKEFVFRENNNFNKQKEVVKEVLTYEVDDLFCMALKFKNQKEASLPICMKDGLLYSYLAVENDYDISSFVSSLNLSKIGKYKKDSQIREERDVKINNDYLEDNEVFILYDYKRVGFYDEKFAKYAVFSNIDHYENNYGALVDKYYLVPRLTSGQTFNTYIKYDVKDGIKYEVNMIYNISKQSYINGVYDGKLYIFDKSAMKQYAIDPVSEEVEVSGDENNNCFAYINGNKTEVSVYDMSKEDVIFSESGDSYTDIERDNIYIAKDYAVYVKDNIYYKVYNKYPNNPIVLFKDDSTKKEDTIKEIRIKDENIYYLKGDSIYRYNKYGNVAILTRNELLFNYKNVYDVYLK